MIIKVISYNILQDSSANPDFVLVNKKYLSNDTRTSLIIKKILSKIEENTIICLQETGETQLQLIIQTFFKLNYLCINIVTNIIMQLSIHYVLLLYVYYIIIFYLYSIFIALLD